MDRQHFFYLKVDASFQADVLDFLPHNLQKAIWGMYSQGDSQRRLIEALERTDEARAECFDAGLVQSAVYIFN